MSVPDGPRLRPWRPADAGTLVAAARDPDIRRWNLLYVASPAAARERIARMHDRWRRETGAIWAVARRTDDRPVGLVGFHDVDLADGSAEILSWVLPEARGAGVVTAAVRRVGSRALDDLGLHRLRLCATRSPTRRPAGLAERAGFALEGTLREALRHEDGRHDQHLHALLRGNMPPAGERTPPHTRP
ncbi:GNAT family N-acetyltransferase [Streptomyces sp. NPDC048566]|uniref:GNAT family N-acetyltransferase n=1 Tax=Streptomyces sp. NPDC048566 TaxID=3365569 RepID=UPI00371EF223